MSRQDKHKITAILRAATHKSKLLSHKSLILLPAAAALGILALVSVLFTSADTASNTYAANLGSQITTEVDGQYYVTLTAPDVNFSVSPSKNENAAKQRIDVGVETNVAGGAKLYLSMAGSSNSLHLNGNTAQSSPVIAAVPNDTDASSFPANTWGYSTDDQTYSAVPTTASDPALLANVDGETTGTTSGSVISASIPVYYAANVDTSIPSGSYSNRMTYSAVVDGGIVSSAELTSIVNDGRNNNPPEIWMGRENLILITTNLKTNTYGTPRVYYTTTNPSGYQECNNVVVDSNQNGYMTVTCTATPTTEATGVTLHIVPKGEPATGGAADGNLTGDPFCADSTYNANSSDCEAGDWKWGSFMIAIPDITIPIFDNVKALQEMTPRVCALSSVGDTKRLQDTRDGKYYWVAKLADGNCWMTQNLELDLAGRTLTPQDSDVSADWDHDAAGGNAYTSAQEGTADYSSIQSWNLGKAVWKNPGQPGQEDPCQSSTNFTDTSSCTDNWQDVSSGWTPMTEYRTDGVTYDAETQTYDAHYLAGNFYSWLAATAGTGASVTAVGEKASDSICPAGWELPTSGNLSGYYSYDDTPGSFRNLLKQYGLSSYYDDQYIITRAPLFFIRAGRVEAYTHLLTNGDQGTYWSSVAYNSSNTNILYFYSNYVSTSSEGLPRYYGLSVRCVAPSA